MVDVNKIIRDILVSMNLEDVTVCFYHPDKEQELPVISYYENTTTTGFCYDNAEQAQNTAVSIDIWANGGGECSRIAIQVDTAMQAAHPFPDADASFYGKGDCYSGYVYGKNRAGDAGCRTAPQNRKKRCRYSETGAADSDWIVGKIKNRTDFRKRGKEMSKQYAVIGLGKFGFSVATTLAQAGKEVLAVDKDAEPVQEIADLVTYAARADITDSRVFASLGISNMDVVIVGISENMESSILATLQAKEAGVPLVIAKGMSQMHANILKKVGADRVVMAESETGIRLGKSLISGGFQDFFMLSDSFSMVELPVPEEWTGHNLEELDLRKKYSINVIAVKDGEDIRVTVNPKTLLRAEEVLILIGENKELAKLMKNRK